MENQRKSGEIRDGNAKNYPGGPRGARRMPDFDRGGAKEVVPNFFPWPKCHLADFKVPPPVRAPQSGHHDLDTLANPEKMLVLERRRSVRSKNNIFSGNGKVGG